MTWGPSPAEVARSEMRVLVTRIDSELSRLRPSDVSPSGERTPLESAWSSLVAILDLGPEPEMRECPVCGALGMRGATLCGNCWSKLTPPDPTP
jgi:hypothetical protein